MSDIVTKDEGRRTKDEGRRTEEEGRRKKEEVGRWLAYGLIGLTVAAFAGYLIVYVIYAAALFQFPFDYDQGEGYELVDTILFSQGEWPYRDIDHYPFYSSNYPPVFHLAIAPLVWLFGPHYWTGRLVSFVGTLITAAAIGYAVHRESGQPRQRLWLTAVAGLAFLASNYVYHVGPLFRQHMFMVMLETLAVVLLTVVVDKEEGDGRPRHKWLLMVMVLLLLAGYTKQLAYATVATVFIFLFLRQSKRAVLWAVPFAAVTGLIFLWINVATDGQWLLNTITANLNPFIPEQAIGLYRQWFQLHTVLILTAGALALYQLYFERLSVYTIWFAVAAVNSVTAGTWGAGESYFATAIAASCILTGLAFNRLLDWSENRERPVWLGTAVLLLIPLLMLIQADKLFHMPTHTPALRAVAAGLGKPVEIHVPPQTSCSAPRPAEAVPYVDSVGPTLLGRPPNAQDRAAGRQIAAMIAASGKAAFSEEAGFNLYAGQEVVTNPTQLLNLYQAGAVDLTEMLQMLDEQQFDLIILRAQFYPWPVLDVIGQRYETTDLVQMNGFVYCVMRPRGARREE
jgi:4-amino-4-deoxy-L-arabinose transferase-like glycosyltransferase